MLVACHVDSRKKAKHAVAYGLGLIVGAIRPPLRSVKHPSNLACVL
jgi:hypothetical protein